ncbi:FkbM family methyltransferase [Variovorax paradoxus]|uniref:FkbM family methyltransferase n=1 Tax=Variovorax paradoxus TaxID=34073 RepID=UPI002785BF29|nr:FkbM family methyltransferase [Variovorax paradoxus]MDP9932885.1 FkbM family methyltransferase [Variovorax paradoxus]
MTETLESPPRQFIQTRYGNLSAPVGATDLITDFLEHYGEWASLEVEYLASMLPRKARILDIGAYVGTFALGLAQAADVSFVAMVEGNAAVASHLATNAARNLRCKHEVLNALVIHSDEPPIEPGRAEPDNAGSASFDQRASGTVRVPLPGTLIGFRALVERFGPLDLVKLDVEGMEEQLLRDHPALLQDASVLLWLECNESRSSLSLAKMLVATGRPVTYFAWPSHNPDNFRGASRKIFPFAYEAGLLLGAGAAPLTAKLHRAGCLMKAIHTVEDLKEALWLTPRWAPREWDALDRNEIAAIATHLWLGRKREDFLAEGESTAGGAADAGADRSGGIVRGEEARLQALKDSRIAQLESKLAEFSSRDLDRERVEHHAEHQEKAARDALCEQQALHQKQVATLMGQADEDRAGQAREMSLLEGRIATCSAQAAAFAGALEGIQKSTTWRTARRLSRMAGRIPFCKRAFRLLMRWMKVQP